jgi:hypothetical protein
VHCVWQPNLATSTELELQLQTFSMTSRLPYTVLFPPSVHVTHHIEKKSVFFIHLKSKEKFSAISA